MIRDLKVYSRAVAEVKSQFAYGELEDIDTTRYKKAFSCLPLEKASKKPQLFLGFEWETDHSSFKGSLHETGKFEWYESRPYKKSLEGILRKALSTPIADYLNYRDEAGKYLELVSIPATLGYHKKTLLKQFFAQKLNKDFRYSRGCGFHVHIDNEYLDVKTVSNMVWFLSNEKNRKFINKIAGRDIDKSSWCSPYGLDLVTYDEKSSLSIPVIETTAGFKVGEDYVSPKSICLNPNTGFGTSELRIFTSPQKYTDIAKNLEFTEALVKFSQATPTLEGVTVEAFKEFIQKKPRRYCHLMKFLKLNKKVKQ